jgi:hypothetical protein
MNRIAISDAQVVWWYSAGTPGPQKWLTGRYSSTGSTFFSWRSQVS